MGPTLYLPKLLSFSDLRYSHSFTHSEQREAERVEESPGQGTRPSLGYQGFLTDGSFSSHSYHAESLVLCS